MLRSVNFGVFLRLGIWGICGFLGVIGLYCCGRGVILRRKGIVDGCGGDALRFVCIWPRGMEGWKDGSVLANSFG